MSKTAVIILLLALGVISGGAGLWYWLNKSDTENASNQATGGSLLTQYSAPAPTIAKEGVKTYTDPAGFSFSYPESLAIKNAADMDEVVDYSRLVVFKTGGQLYVRVSDTKQKKVADWLAKDTQAPEGVTLAGATSLGDLSAEQYSDEKNLYTLVIDQGILYMITSPKDAEWEKIHETVVSSFKFEDQKSTAPSGGTGGDDMIYEEEEVIE